MGSATIEFGTLPCESVPAFVTSFAHPAHVDSFPSEIDSDATVEDGTEWREMDVRAPILGTPSCRESATSIGPAPGPPSPLARSVQPVGSHVYAYGANQGYRG